MPRFSTQPDDDDPDGHARRDLIVRIGHDELVVRRRYETLSILNDLAAALMFVVGSALFFSPSTSTAATWLFLVGSVLLLFRPVIRLTRRVHLQRKHPEQPHRAHETSMDF